MSNFLGKTYYNGVYNIKYIAAGANPKRNVILPKSLVRAEEWFRVACKQKAEKEYCENQKAVQKMLEKGLK